MKREEILEAAKRCVSGDRVQNYGRPENNFKRIATLWSAYLYGDAMQDYPDTPMLTAKDVAAMMALMKIARIASGHAKEDNWVDGCGYLACGGELETEAADDTRDF